MSYCFESGNSQLDDEEQTIIAICTASSRLGCAIYHDSTIHLIADRSGSGDPNIGIDVIIQKVDPDIVVIAGGGSQLFNFLDRRFEFNVIDIHRGNRNVSGVVDPAFTLAIVPNSWFSISYGESTLIESEWVRNKGYKDSDQQSFFVYSRVKKSVDVCAIRSISAIDKFLKFNHTADKAAICQAPNESQCLSARQLVSVSQISQNNRVPDEARNIERYMPILDVRYMDPGPVISIDKFTFQTLGIFPKNQRKKPEQYDVDNPPLPTLHEILNQCQSSLGKKTMQTIMVWPVRELEVLQYRYETVDFFSRPENKLFREQIIIQLKNMVPLTGILTKLNQSIGSFKDLSTVYKSLWAFMAILDLIRANNCTELEAFKRIISLDSPILRASVDSIINTIDFEASKREQRIQVCLGVDQDVDEKKEVVKNLAKYCDEVAAEETVRYKDIIGKTFRVLYIPRIGFLSSITYTSSAELTRIWSNNEFEVLLHTEQSVYFKTKKMEELDRDAGDIACDLIDVQENVVVNLQSEVLQHSETILKIMEVCGELDCLITFSIISTQRNFTRPDLTENDSEIDIRQAFHPLRSASVPNDIRFISPDNKNIKVIVITGPNSCGKTTYMKMVCLIVYMAHIGCFVPAQYAKIPMVDAILTRMHSANSISTGLSSFATDLNQINYALSRATSRSLIAIDEFGKGTKARDGFHLLKGLIAYFATRGNASPYVMVATHFNRVINHLQAYAESILYKTFKIVRDPSNDTIVYEFRLIDGVSESSLADQVATKAGVPRTIIERASQIRDYITGGRPIQSRVPPAA